MVYATMETIQIFLSSQINIFMVLVAFVLIAALWSMRRPAGLPPGPRGFPFIGNIFDMSGNPMLTMSDFAKTYGDMFSLKMGLQNVVVLNNAKVVREALVKKQDGLSKRPWVYSIDLLTEGGQDITYGKRWKIMRKFGHKAVRNFASGYPLERAVTKVAFPNLKKAIIDKNGEPFNPRSILKLCVCNVLSNICFGNNYDFDDTEFKNIMQIVNDMDDIFANGTLADIEPMLKYIPTKTIRQMKKVANTWIRFIQSKIDDHRMNIQEGSDSDIVHDVLKLQAELKGTDQADGLTDVQARQLVADVFGAGVDTTTETLIWCVAYSVSYPDVQAKVQKELDDVIGRDRSPLLSDKAKLPYCEAVILEVMRIRTTMPYNVPHETTENTVIGGYNIPKGTQIWTNFQNLHMDEEYWKEPEKFCPERFLDDKGRVEKRQESYFPFSTGCRMCVGETLTRNEMFLILTCLFQQFTLSPVKGKGKPSLEPTFSNLVTRCMPYEVVVKERISGKTDSQA
ncbi:cytochrome P450 1A5-like isoform X1 [Ptychodera flava]|uniref:cytochrome P450 1A5-like isoform X1 n=1 Tax=Ptychodera flava TaxID=63121 RepID=UPI00396A5F3C